MNRNRRRDLKEFEEDISYSFKDMRLLEEAFVHSSFVNERPERGLKSNERLELLGDAVLSTVITHKLMDRFPEMNEGELSVLRARLVNERSLSHLAGEMDLGLYLMLSRGEDRSGGRGKSSILADTCEALIAAIYLDGGFEAAFNFISGRFEGMLNYILEKGESIDYKTILQEYTQRDFGEVPTYEIAEEYGPQHERVFKADVIIGGRRVGSGVGQSKKEAQKCAAREALERLRQG